MATLTYERTLRLTIVSCCACGIEYGIPEELNRRLLEKKHTQDTYCPNGHAQVFTGRSMEQQLKDKDAQLDDAYTRLTQVRDQLAAANRSNGALRAARTRAARKASAGVCPVEGCKRHFDNLAGHMESKHPDYVPPDP